LFVPGRRPALRGLAGSEIGAPNASEFRGQCQEAPVFVCRWRIDNPTLCHILAPLVKPSTLKTRVAAAFSPGELEYLLRNQTFRLIYDSDDERPETAEKLHELGRSLLSGQGVRRDLQS
jgi:hypothetical protein